MIKKLILVVTLMLGAVSLNAQTEEELKKEQAAKKDSIAAIQARVDALQGQIDALPGWKIGAFGTIGGNIGGFNNWFTQDSPNNSSGNIGITVNAYANLLREKDFWRNSLNVNLAWVKLDNKDNDDDVPEVDDENFEPSVDVFNLTSLYGYKISKTLAVSTLGEYRTTILNDFNDPGYLDIGIGVTWTPIENLIVVVHPLNYNFVFSSGDSQFESSLGAKVVADYTRQIGAINFKSNLSAFLSYEDGNYSNWQWTNSFSYTLWKSIGVGFDFGLRNSRQEAFNFALGQVPAIVPTPTIDSVDNDLQSFWNLGLSYSF